MLDLMLRTAICDDNELYLERAEKIFARECEEYSPEISLFSTGTELIRAMEKGYRPEVLVLDIVLNDGDNGINVAKEVNRLCPDCGIIFLTAYISYASDVYETKHSYFIVKSQLEKRIKAAVEKTISGTREKKFLSFNNRFFTTVFPIDEILYLERSLKKTIIIHNSGRKYETYAKPTELLKNLDEIFVQCHKSYYVNMTEIAAVEGDFFLLKNGARIPISRSRKQKAKDSFHDFVSREVCEN